MQYYIQLNPRLPGVDFESNAFPRVSDQIESIAKALGLPSHFEFFSYEAQEDLCPPDLKMPETPWFDATVGIDWLKKILAHIRADPASVPDPEKLTKDLNACVEVLRQAESAGVKWHFAMDI